MNQWSKKLNFTWDVHQDKDWGMVPKSGWYSSSCLIDRFSVCLSRSKYFHLLFSFYFPSVFLFLFSYILLFNYSYFNCIYIIGHHLVIFISLFIFIDTTFITHPVLLFIYLLICPPICSYCLDISDSFSFSFAFQ